MTRFLLVLVVTIAAVSVAAAIKEWKNFENGKVYSHKTPNDKKESETHGMHTKSPVVEERLLHSHHRDKKMRTSSLQTTDGKPVKGKNPERHHRKSVEEEMGLRPLNERHHKFPNPALLDQTNKGKKPDSQITTKDLVKQTKHARVNNRRRQHGKRMKRNRGEQRGALKLLDNNNNNSEIGEGHPQVAGLQNTVTTENPENPDFTKISPQTNEEKTQFTRDGYPLKISSYW